MQSRLQKIMLYPLPLRLLLLQHVLLRLPIFPYAKRLEWGAAHRPHYGYCILNAARMARQLGHRAVSIIEFGVAGGAGLVDIERHVEALRKEIDIDFQVYGFDTGKGLPKPTDYRDLPYHWKEGFFEMDEAALRQKLKTSKLVLGNIKDTIGSFVSTYNPAPIGAIFFDMDYYSSTMDSFAIFDAEPRSRLPRVFCYFDDVIGTDVELYNEFSGELLAISEFNEANPRKKVSRTRHLRAGGSWHDQIYIFHDFDHPNYCDFISAENQQIRL